MKKYGFSLIFDLAEEQSVAWDRFPGVASGTALEQLVDPGLFPSPASYVKEGADDGPDHIPKEPVGPDGEHEIVVLIGRITHDPDMVRSVCLPKSRLDGADGSLVVAADLLEAAEIMGPQQLFGRPVHSPDIQREGVKVRILE